MNCTLCQEPIAPGDVERNGSVGFVAHTECSLRSVIGGIGHLLDHAHFCHGPLGPDAGLTFRESAMLVDVFVRMKGVEAAASIRADV